jgi:glucose/arabinose dehydrogenase
VIAKPVSAVPRVPPGFQVELFASNLRDPRTVRVAPNGDIFIAESEPGRIRVLRAADGAAKPSSNEVFASGLDQPFGIAFYPSGSEPQWIYVANTGSVVRYPYRSGDLKAREKAEVIVRDLPHAGGRSVQRGHITRDIVFSKDGRQMFVSVGSASNDGEGMGKRDAAAIARWEAEHGLGSAWGNETNRAAVLVFDPEGRNRRVFASGLRNCVGLAVHPLTGDLWCSTNEREISATISCPTSLRVCVAALSTAGLGTIWAQTKIRRGMENAFSRRAGHASISTLDVRTGRL